MNSIKLPSTILLFAILLLQCTTAKQVAEKSDKDYNKRQVLSNHRYERKLNIVGGAGLGISTIAAGLALRQYPLVLTSDDEGTTNENNNSNAVLGCVAGFGIASTLTYKVGHWGEQTMVNQRKDKQEWLNKFDANLIELPPYDTTSSMRVIDRRVEPKFEVRTLEDGLDFLVAFPASTKKNTVFEAALKLANSKYEIFRLMEACRDCSGIPQAQAKGLELLENPNEVDIKIAESISQNLGSRKEHWAYMVKIHEQNKLASYSYPSTNFYLPYEDENLVEGKWNHAETPNGFANDNGILYYSNETGGEYTIFGRFENGRIEDTAMVIFYRYNKVPLNHSMVIEGGNFVDGIAQGLQILEMFPFKNVGAPIYRVSSYKNNKIDTEKPLFNFFEDGSKMEMKYDPATGTYVGEIRVGKNWFASMLKCTASSLGGSLAKDPLAQALISEGIEAVFDNRRLEKSNILIGGIKNEIINEVEKSGYKRLAFGLKVFDWMYCIYSD